MRVKYILFTLIPTLLMTWFVIASAADIDVDEVNLPYSPGFAEVYEVHHGVDGYIYLSDDSNLGNLIRLDPSNGNYASYVTGAPVLDAKPDGNGNVWWVDGAESFSRLELSNSQLTTWDLPVSEESRNIRGLDFDDQDRVWMTEFIGASSNLFRFDLSTSEFCTYTISMGNSQSYYILHDKGEFWLGNWGANRIYQVDTVLGQASYWNIPYADSWPKGLALDDNGDLWWADQGLGAIGRLQPEADEMRFYALPHNVPNDPQMLTIRPEGIWYTENVTGTLGLLKPSVASSETVAVTTGSKTVTSACITLDPTGNPFTVPPSTSTFTWDSYTLPPGVDSAGWSVYQLPTDPGDVEPKAYGLSYANGYLWASDQGRQKLIRLLPGISGVSIQKHTEGEDADVPTGPVLRVGDPVNWEYFVTNGAIPLSSVSVVDDDLNVTVSCPKSSLTAEESMTCTASGIVEVGQYSNTATVSGNDGEGTIEDSDPSHYYGVNPKLNLEKTTNGQDADAPPGPAIQVGEEVNWLYTVQNNGDVPLTGVTVSDDDGSIQIDCPRDDLPVGISMACTASGVVKTGQYQNRGSVVGYYGDLQASDQDYSHYYGQSDQYHIYLPILMR